jgi:hypothetical protein
VLTDVSVEHIASIFRVNNQLIFCLASTGVSEEHIASIFKDEKISLFFTVMMEPICSSETSVDTQRTTRRHIPEDGTFHNHRGETIKFYTV